MRTPAIDAAAHQATMAAVARGEQDMLTAEETAAALASERRQPRRAP
jgi:hypothetical protein